MAHSRELRWKMAEEVPKPQAAGEEAPAKAPPAVDAAELQRELEDSRKRGEELFTRLQYVQAELENTWKRAERDLEQGLRTANEGLLGRLLPVLDDLDAAIASLKGKARKGVEMVRENVLRALGEFGLEEIPAAGLAFDPYLHECVQHESDDVLPDGQVKEVVRKGYRLRMKPLRPAQVIVAKKGAEQKEGERNA